MSWSDTVWMASQSEDKQFTERHNSYQRKGAVRRRVYRVNGHKFTPTRVCQPTRCCHCCEYIAALPAGADRMCYQCQVCSTYVHKNCHELVITKCADCMDGIVAHQSLTTSSGRLFSVKTFLQLFLNTKYKRLD